jgi:hypothetical protein
MNLRELFAFIGSCSFACGKSYQSAANTTPAASHLHIIDVAGRIVVGKALRIFMGG